MPVMTLESDDVEAFDESMDESDYEFDEGESDESEFLGPLLGSLPIIGPAISGLIAPRPPVPPVPAPVPRPGVSSAVLATPRGTATIRMPEPVVSRSEFLSATGSLRASINRTTGRVNTVQGDVAALGRRVGEFELRTRRDIGRVRADVGKVRKDTRASIAKLRKAQQSQAMTSLLVSFMAQRRVQDAVTAQATAFNTHVHKTSIPPMPTGGEVESKPPTTPMPAASGTDTTTLLLPLLLLGGQDGGFGGGDNMMMLVLLFTLMK